MKQNSSDKKIWTTVTQYDAKYASEVMERIPYGYINKTVCGCGMTTVALENSYPTIIAVPTIVLALNKAEQYPNDRCSYKMLVVYGDTEDDDIRDYLMMCKYTNQPLKIIVVYDSLRRVDKLIPQCDLVIDESQEVLKIANTFERRRAVQNMLRIAEEHKERVSFVSATPIPVSYMPEWVQKLPQLKINWTNTIKVNPILMERTYPHKALKDEILNNIQSSGSVVVGGKKFSKVIVFVNSITTILKVVKDCKLAPEDVSILCGKGLDNDIKIRKYKRYSGGELPRYLFSTSSGFSGIDLYDDEAMTVVVSNASKHFTMLDYMTDVKQAVSRNRSEVNPTKGTYIYIYNKNLLEEPEEAIIDKMDRFYTEVEHYVKFMNDRLESGADPEIIHKGISSQYKPYIIDNMGRYEVSSLSFQADKYYILEVRKQYLKGFDVQSYTNGVAYQKLVAKNVPNVTYKDVVEYFKIHNKDGKVTDWGYCSTKPDYISLIEEYYDITGSTTTNYTLCKTIVSKYEEVDREALKNTIRKSFRIDQEYETHEIRSKLKKIYKAEGLDRYPKATDIYEIYPNTAVRKSNGKRYYVIQK